MNYNWDLSTLYKNEEEYQRDLLEFKGLITKFNEFKVQLHDE